MLCVTYPAEIHTHWDSSTCLLLEPSGQRNHSLPLVLCPIIAVLPILLCLYQNRLSLLGGLLGLVASQLGLSGGLDNPLGSADGGDTLNSVLAEISAVSGLGGLVGNSPVGPGAKLSAPSFTYQVFSLCRYPSIFQFHDRA